MKKPAADDQVPALSRKEEILAAAASLFRQQGFERTSVREIAQALGMTSGSLFYHFASKEDLLVMIMEEGLRAITRSVQQARDSEAQLPQRLLAMMRRHLAALLGPRLDAMSVLLYEWRSLSPAAQAKVLALRDAYEDLWTQSLQQAADQGCIDADVALVRQTLLGALNWSAQWYKPGGRLDIDTLAQRMFVMLFPRMAVSLPQSLAVA
ncbi:TetR family transcriptional regulator [Extensimonas vulgaris]|uniref:TetR family transcriptional regulator n=2 Tax=Extensimonas vulgaris TaxID=1031594 RepID=A0A369AKK1_9BURK|nr:TetR family transcriptional regulator [Extensimonas vulgaris]TWI39321.1 TetR family transcriptional regulator [Extensimonas vulgaris]TXD15683.1 TetR/AcrR family transcriptional regulator [Extensimonas vulgaris]